MRSAHLVGGVGHLFAADLAALSGIDLVSFEGPVPLVQRGLPVPSAPGVYIVASGACVSHIGTSGGLRSRLRSLATLGTHRGSVEVLCASYCTHEAPNVWWLTTPDIVAARVIERGLKLAAGEPPIPRAQFAGCVNGLRLQQDLIEAAGAQSWEAGYIEAVFAIGEKLKLLLGPRFDPIWRKIGIPPGPWA